MVVNPFDNIFTNSTSSSKLIYFNTNYNQFNFKRYIDHSDFECILHGIQVVQVKCARITIISKQLPISLSAVPT